MFRRILNSSRSWSKNYAKVYLASQNRVLLAATLPFSLLTRVRCEKTQYNYKMDDEALGHEFLIKQASTVNVNAATQLLTVTLVAIQDTSERLREALSQEICLVKQALEWGETNTPESHWDQLVALRANLGDLKYNLRVLFNYMEYAEKLATTAAEVSYLSGNMAASDAICERIDHANRTCKNENSLTSTLQQESLDLQKQAIIQSPQLEDLIIHRDDNDEDKPRKKKT